jgi:hypothetical protein
MSTLLPMEIDSSSAISLNCAILLFGAILIRDGGAVKTTQRMSTPRLLVKNHGNTYTGGSTIPPGC